MEDEVISLGEGDLRLLDKTTPVNACLRGAYKKSFACYTLKERVPVILTRTIDYLSRESEKIKSSYGATDEDVIGLIQYISKLKNELVTNKKYAPLTVDTPEAKSWNQWIESVDCPTYFTNIWLFSECYVYRRLWEGCELSKNLKNFDYFEEQKQQAFLNSLEPMCVVADKLVDMLEETDVDKQKSDFIKLLKISLWSNKNDLSLSLGEQVSLDLKNKLVDPFQIILDLEDKLLADDTMHIAEQVITKEASCTDSKDVIFDIVCDNSGYELFTDLCLAHFLISKNIVHKIRFHVKRIPWFVSDVTPNDFKYVINACSQAKFSKNITDDGSETVNSDNLRKLGEKWNEFCDNGTFSVMNNDFWTSPHPYKDMKKYDMDLYKKLQSPVAILFKGDLNYRKLLADINWDPVVDFSYALQGFMPAPVIALRTIKADLICGLPKGKWEQLNEIDDKWMGTGDYGVIQFCSTPVTVEDISCVPVLLTPNYLTARHYWARS